MQEACHQIRPIYDCWRRSLSSYGTLLSPARFLSALLYNAGELIPSFSGRSPSSHGTLHACSRLHHDPHRPASSASFRDAGELIPSFRGHSSTTHVTLQHEARLPSPPLSLPRQQCAVVLVRYPLVLRSSLLFLRHVPAGSQDVYPASHFPSRGPVLQCSRWFLTMTALSLGII